MFTETLEGLTQHVATGDRPAATTLRAELRPQLERILRRALRPGTPSSPFTDRLRREAQAALRAETHRNLRACEPLVASQLTNRLIDRLRSPVRTGR
jgi:hypothetical protein